jgi:eukaryotic-like serine/threonine-protein kinase
VQPAGDGKDALLWQGTSRYEVLRCIGRGGMGVVYEAYDRERGRRIAIKTLLRFSPSALYLFKQEFRTLANVLHPNLVRLHELVASETEGVFFTMELVAGQDFRTYTQRADARAALELPPATTDGRPGACVETLSGTSRVDEAAGTHPIPSPLLDEHIQRRTTPADIDRLYDALRQLAEGVHALHLAGKVHRDIKPSNVLVGEEGRVVLLDFGVAAELSRVVDERWLESHRVGTAEYMAPEQALRQPITAASDWYSVGALLYEALVGKPPFVGDANDVLYRKALLDPPAPREVVDGVPEDLDALCCDLLQRAPEERAGGRKVLRWLGGPHSKHPSPPPAAAAESGTHLVGRSAELHALRDAFDVAGAGRTSVVRVNGPSGIGKSALVKHFLDDLVTRGDAVPLRGRAYERESIAYKAVDGVVDALSRYLIALELHGEPVVLPGDSWAIACLFPVLRRVESIGRLSAGPVNDPQRVRQLAFSALRALLTDLANRRPLVIHIDDAQWGDVDSATLLLEVLRPPSGPPLLLVLGHQDGVEAAQSPFLSRLVEHGLEGLEVRDLSVNPLGIADARQLALDLLGSEGDAAERVADAIARGSGGSAFFIEDLARSVYAQGLLLNADVFIVDTRTTIEQMIQKRVANLGDEARRVLELIAVHGRPVPTSILQDGADVSSDLDSLVNALRGGHFVRLAARDGREMVETTHDRITETVLDGLATNTVREHHRRLAVAYESQPQIEAEAIVAHWFGAGEPERAARYAERAAENAAEKLAFEQAVHLYRLTLDALPPQSPQALQVRVRLAEALGWVGRGAEAARLYLEAARVAAPDQRAALERAGANQLLFCGQIEEGARILRRNLAQIGRGAPESALSAVFWLIVYSVWIRVIGLRFVERDTLDVPPRQREHLEALYAAVAGLALVDVIVGTSLSARYMVLAFRSGYRLAIIGAVMLRASQLAMRGGPVSKEEIALESIGKDLVKRVGDDLARSVAGPETELAPPPFREEPQQAVEAVHAVQCFLHGRWRETYEACEKAYTELPVARGMWNVHALAVYGEFARVFMGEAADLAVRFPRLLSDAERRGDLLKIVNLRTGVAPIVFLAKDEPAAARRHVLDGMAQWSQGGFLLQHWRAMIAEVEIDLYDHNGRGAYDRLARDARAYRRSFLGVAQYVRAVTSFAHARAAVASWQEAPVLRSRLREARRMGQQLRRAQVPWMSALGSLVAAAVAHAEDDRAATSLHLRTGAEEAEAVDMALHACSARHRLGTLLGGAEGRLLVEEAERGMRAKGVRAPDRYVAMLIPGTWPRS